MDGSAAIARRLSAYELKVGGGDGTSGSAPLTPPADHEHHDGHDAEHEHDHEHDILDDLFAAAAETLAHDPHHGHAAAMVPSDSSPGSPQNFPDAAAAAVHAKHGRKLGQPRRSPLARTMSSSPGVVFQFGTPSVDHAETSFQILQYPHSKQPPLAAHVVPSTRAAAAAAALAAGAPALDDTASPSTPPSESDFDSDNDDMDEDGDHDHDYDHDDDEDDEDDDTLQEVPFFAAGSADALRVPHADSSFEDGAEPRPRPAPVQRHRDGHRQRDGHGHGHGHSHARKATSGTRVKSLSLPHPTPARASVFYPKNPKSDRVPGGKQANTGNKKCFACGTKKTPYWRDGWDGVLLCNACGIRFTKYRLRCLKCLYVPRKDEKHFHNCVKCGTQMPPPAR